MRVLVSGSRSFNDNPKLVIGKFNQFLRENNISLEGLVVINGYARGVDQIIRKHCIDHLAGVKVKDYRANWERDGKSAGFKRNKLMLNDGRPQILFAVWDGYSSGTKHMIDLCRQAGVKTCVYQSTNWMNEKGVEE